MEQTAMERAVNSFAPLPAERRAPSTTWPCCRDMHVHKMLPIWPFIVEQNLAVATFSCRHDFLDRRYCPSLLSIQMLKPALGEIHTSATCRINETWTVMGIGLYVRQYAKCEYCGSIIISDRFKFCTTWKHSLHVSHDVRHPKAFAIEQKVQRAYAYLPFCSLL